MDMFSFLKGAWMELEDRPVQQMTLTWRLKRSPLGELSSGAQGRETSESLCEVLQKRSILLSSQKHSAS